MPRSRPDDSTPAPAWALSPNALQPTRRESPNGPFPICLMISVQQAKRLQNCSKRFARSQGGLLSRSDLRFGWKRKADAAEGVGSATPAITSLAHPVTYRDYMNRCVTPCIAPMWDFRHHTLPGVIQTCQDRLLKRHANAKLGPDGRTNVHSSCYRQGNIRNNASPFAKGQHTPTPSHADRARTQNNQMIASPVRGGPIRLDPRATQYPAL